MVVGVGDVARRISGCRRWAGWAKEIGGTVVIEDEMVLQAKVEYLMVALILPIVEGVGQGQGQVVECKAGMPEGKWCCNQI